MHGVQSVLSLFQFKAPKVFPLPGGKTLLSCCISCGTLMCRSMQPRYFTLAAINWPSANQKNSSSATGRIHQFALSSTGQAPAVRGVRACSPLLSVSVVTPPPRRHWSGGGKTSVYCLLKSNPVEEQKKEDICPICTIWFNDYTQKHLTTVTGGSKNALKFAQTRQSDR